MRNSTKKGMVINRNRCSVFCLAFLTALWALGLGRADAAGPRGVAGQHRVITPHRATAPPFGKGTIWTEADAGHLAAVKKLLARNPRLVNASRSVKGTDWTPLVLAAIAGHVDVTAYLLDHGANVNQRRRITGRPPLYDVIIWGSNSHHRPEILRLLIRKKAKVNDRVEHGWLPLHYVTDVESARILLENGARINDKANGRGLTPLHAFIRYNLSSMAKRGEFKSALAVIRFLIDKGATVTNTDKQGKTMLYYVQGVSNLSQRRQVIDLLKSHGAKE